MGLVQSKSPTELDGGLSLDMQPKSMEELSRSGT